MDGQLIGKYCNKGSGIGQFDCPRICMSDREGCLLIADVFNDRLQLRLGEQWLEPHLKPQPSRPIDGVYDGHVLFVVSLTDADVCKLLLYA